MSRAGSTASSRATASTTTVTASSIWAARNVEWPIPSSLSTANYQKLLRASRQTGAQLGISSTAQDPRPGESVEDETGTDGPPSSSAGGGSSKEESNYFTGFMSRLVNTSGTP